MPTTAGWARSTAHGQRYGQALLRSLGHHQHISAPAADLPSAWRATGLPDPLPPAALANAADGCAAALAALAGRALPLRGAEMLGQRRRLGGPSSSRCQQFATAQGQLVLNLARDDDYALLSAWLEADIDGSDVQALQARLQERSARAWCARGRELGLALAAVQAPWQCTTPAIVADRHAAAAARPERPPKVLDLSTLWAGPLAAQCLRQAAGSEVIKLDSRARPDGARLGAPAFHAALNDGKRELSLDDLRSPDDLKQLRAAIAWADIVIESARPRGLRQLGIVAEDCIAQRPGLTWVSITGHGRGADHAQHIAYGDDAAVAAGLGWLQCRSWGGAAVVGDAIADPLTGLHAAVVALAGSQRGGGQSWRWQFSGVVRQVLGFGAPASHRAWRARAADWRRVVQKG